jgi:hypothetical protein
MAPADDTARGRAADSAAIRARTKLVLRLTPLRVYASPEKYRTYES